jgi:hypothetical protein
MVAELYLFIWRDTIWQNKKSSPSTLLAPAQPPTELEEADTRRHGREPSDSASYTTLYHLEIQ